MVQRPDTPPDLDAALRRVGPTAAAPRRGRAADAAARTPDREPPAAPDLAGDFPTVTEAPERAPRDPAPAPAIPVLPQGEREVMAVTYNRPRWITQDSLLRDEGVYYGRGLGDDADAAALVDEKLGAIRDWYDLRAAVVRRREEQLEDLRDRAARKVQALEERRAEAEGLRDAAEARYHPHVDQLRARLLTAVPLAATTVLHLGLVLWFLAGTDGPPALVLLLAAALWTAGHAASEPIATFLLVNTTDERRTRWKQLAEEWGLPVAASLALASLGYASRGPLVTAAVTIVSAPLFALVGRALMRVILGTPDDRRSRRRVAHDRHLATAETARHTRTLERLGAELERERATETQLRHDSDALQLRLLAIEGERDRKVNLFLSEFRLATYHARLARSAADPLTD